MQRLDRERAHPRRPHPRRARRSRRARARAHRSGRASPRGAPRRRERGSAVEPVRAGGGERRGLFDRDDGCRRSRRRRCGPSGRVKNPPRQCVVNRRPESASSFARASSRPTSCTGSRHSPIACTPASAVTRRAVARSAYLIVAWLIESRGIEALVQRHASTPFRRSIPCHRCAASSGCSSASEAFASSTMRTEVRQAAGRVQAADHLERGLVAVQPGQERDTGLVVERRRGEDLPAELLGRAEEREVAVGVAGVQRLDRCRGDRRDRGEGAQQRVGVPRSCSRSSALIAPAPCRRASDEADVVEVVAGEHAHALGKALAHRDLGLRHPAGSSSRPRPCRRSRR